MTNIARATSVLLLVDCLGLGGCGADESQSQDDQSWTPIISADWSLAAGTENWFCASKTLTEDLYIGGYRPIQPLGTHHTVLSFGDPVGPDDVGSDCDPGTENPYWIYASGVGTNDLLLPEGVGVKIPAGMQVHVNLHLFNVTEGQMTGRSGVEILPLTASEVVNEAEMFLPGPFNFMLPPNQQSTATGTCTLAEEQKLV